MQLRQFFLAALVIFTVASGPLLLRASATQSTVTSPAEEAAVTQFDEAIAKYMTLRRSVRSEVAGPVKNSTSTQVTDAGDALAGAIQRARQGAKIGSIFSVPISAMIKRRIADAVRTEKLAAVLAHIDDDEAKAGPAPKVHLRLPVSAQMATMPSSLLAILPRLPKELEYRILGRYLVLRDVDASLILDYIPDAVPR